MNFKLTDNSRIHVAWTQSSALAIELWQPGMAKDGHGYLYRGHCLIEGDTLRALFRYLSQQQQRDPKKYNEINNYPGWGEKLAGF